VNDKIKEGKISYLIILALLPTLINFFLDVEYLSDYIESFDIWSSSILNIFMFLLALFFFFFVSILPLGCIALFVLCAYFLIKKRKIIYIIPMLILSLNLIPVNNLRHNVNFKENYDRRMEIVEAIKTGKLTYNEYGRVIDDQDIYNLEEVSLHGFVEVLYHDGNDYIISFWYKHLGEYPENDKYFIYSSGGIELFENETDYTIIEILDDNWLYVNPQ